MTSGIKELVWAVESKQRQNCRLKKIFFAGDASFSRFVPTLISRDKNIFESRYEENAISAVINILEASVFSGSKKHFLRMHGFREMCRH